MTRLKNALALMRGQLWIIPLLLTIVSFGLSYVVLASGNDVLRGWQGSDRWWLYSGDAGTARGLLSSLLSGLMTVLSLIISITFVILTLAANQLGPRLITTFMADRQIQVVLGLFLGTILYLLMVLRSLNESLGAEGVPHIAVTLGSALTILCLFALLFYVHKVARSIIADTVVARVAGELQHAIATLPSDPGPDPAPVPDWAGADGISLSVGRVGYIQTIDYGRLLEIAREHDVTFTVDVRAGHFLLRNGAHVTIHAARPGADKLLAEVRGAFVVGSDRSPAQDLEYGIRQLVEVALRALSPGINDLYTAIAVIDRLAAALESAAERSLPPALLKDDTGIVRIYAQRSDFEGLMDAAFDTIRQAGRDLPAIQIHIADVLRQLAPALRSTQMRRAVLTQLRKLSETAEASTQAASDAQEVAARIRQAEIAVAAHPPAGCPSAP
jgi:uncharacterized membrane protein